MLDFTSALYLGLAHASWRLPAWERLTLGKPAALESPPGTAGLERDLAALIGCERALLAPSTLHLFWDLFKILAARGVNLFVEEGAYPIAGWGIERAAAAGVPVRTFRRHSPQSLRVAIEDAERKRGSAQPEDAKRKRGSAQPEDAERKRGSAQPEDAKRKRASAQPQETERKPPIVVADGYCPGCGRPAPLAAYLECTKPQDGLVVIDDTQALGIFGHSQSEWAPYGWGGGGSLQRAGIRDSRVVVASSLAKGFGVPMAVLAASEAIAAEFELKSETRVHCSPASVAAIAAAKAALARNRHCGDVLRWNLAQRVARFRRGLGKLKMAVSASPFPVQPLRLPEGVEAGAVHEALLDRGVQAVLHRASDGAAARISFVVTSRHTFSEIDYALACLANVVKAARETFKGGKSNGKSTEFTGAALPGFYGSPK